MIRLLAPFNEKVHNLNTRLGGQVRCDNSASKEVLGMEYRTMEQSLVEMFQGLIDVGIIENKLPKNFERPKL